MLQTTTSRADYYGNGSTTSFAVPFYFLASSDLEVYVDGVEKILGTDYTVTGAGSEAGGTVLLTVAPLSGVKVNIIRVTPYTQLTHYIENDPFPAASHERALDKLTMQVQQLAEESSRSLHLAPDVTGVMAELPTPEGLTLIGWNPEGTALQNLDPADFATVVAYGTTNADIFLGDGVTRVFTLTDNPGTQANLDVAISGVTQYPGVDYAWSGGKTVTFAAAPPSGAKVLLRYFQGLAQGTADAAATIYSPAGGVQRPQSDKNADYWTTLDFASFAAALAKFGSTPATLHVNSPVSVNDNTAVPATLTLVVDSPGTIDVATGKTLTILGSFSAPIGTVFVGDGAVVFGAGSVAGAYPHWWGSPSVDAAAPVQAAANSLATYGGDVLFPPGDYNFQSGVIDIPVGVNLIGQGGKLYRKFPYVSTDSTTAWVFTINGSNSIRGLYYDAGGWDASVYPGVGNGAAPYTYYQDFHTVSTATGLRFTDNIFVNGSGAFITPFGSDIVISGNVFREWRDHCVYLAEASSTARKGYVVSNNTFTATRSSDPTIREPVKFKGRVSNIAVTGNTFDLPYETLSFVTLGLAYNGTIEFGDITVSGNTGYTAAAFVRVEQYDDGAGSLDTGIVDTVNIVGNTVKCAYFLRAGGLPGTGIDAQQGIRINALTIKGNTSYYASIIQINGRDGVGHNGILFCDISDNNFNLGGSPWLLMGNIQHLRISGNTFATTTANYWPAITFGDASSASHWKAGTINTSFKGNASIVGNTLGANIRYLVTDYGVDATHPSCIGLDLYVDGNVFMSTAGGGASAFVNTVAAYPPTTKLQVGPMNYVAPSIGSIASPPFVWPAALVKYSGVASVYGYRTSSGAPSSLTPQFIGEECLDTVNAKWYKAKGTTTADWVALN